MRCNEAAYKYQKLTPLSCHCLLVVFASIFPRRNSCNFSKDFANSATAHEAFECINNVTGWWTTNLEGSSKEIGNEFTVRFGDVHYSKQKLVEVVPDEKVVWLVTDSKLNFIKDKQEWTNTTISFEIARDNHKTRIDFKHMGLVPEIECYNSCTKAWDRYIKGSLLPLLVEGKGTPG